MPSVIAIVGPTAIGKSDLALRLAEVFRGEIVSGDSRHVYKYLDIGTNKPSPSEREQVPHHLLDIIYPDNEYSLANYRIDAALSINQIISRGGIPFVVGGSGLYIRALLENWQVPAIPPDPAFRISCEIEAERSGVDALYERLFAVDPGEAARIGPHNLRRIIRALEMYRATDVAPSQLKTRGQSPYTYLIIGLTSDRDTLYSRINNRVEMMLKSGLVDEVKGIIDLGYDLRQSAFSSIGYREIGRYLKGEIDLSSAVELIKISTHRFARRQYTWFRPLADALVWLDCATDPYPIAAEKIRPFLQDATN